nr:hypothetical protein [Candidatus Sigynarchaeota archaeon]
MNTAIEDNTPWERSWWDETPRYETLIPARKLGLERKGFETKIVEDKDKQGKRRLLCREGLPNHQMEPLFVIGKNSGKEFVIFTRQHRENYMGGLYDPDDNDIEAVDKRDRCATIWYDRQQLGEPACNTGEIRDKGSIEVSSDVSIEDGKLKFHPPADTDYCVSYRSFRDQNWSTCSKHSTLDQARAKVMQLDSAWTV